MYIVHLLPNQVKVTKESHSLHNSEYTVPSFYDAWIKALSMPHAPYTVLYMIYDIYDSFSIL